MSEQARWKAWFQGFPVVSRTKAESWAVGVDRTLPVKEFAEWDGQRAQDQIFTWAGWDDNPDPAKARRCFLLHKTSDPELRGSYKFPICYVQNGSPVVASSGMSAAASYLPKGNIPPAAEKSARAALDHFYKKLEKERA